MRSRVAILATVLVLGMLAMSAPSIAGHDPTDPDNAFCDTFELCLHHNSNLQGATIGFYNNVAPNYGTHRFFGPGTGANHLVWNDAASAKNLDPDFYVRIYFNSNCGGTYDQVNKLTWRNLANTYNENASHRWAGTPSCQPF